MNFARAAAIALVLMACDQATPTDAGPAEVDAGAR